MRESTVFQQNEKVAVRFREEVSRLSGLQRRDHEQSCKLIESFCINFYNLIYVLCFQYSGTDLYNQLFYYHKIFDINQPAYKRNIYSSCVII